ncbi:MAG: hypothetical protein FWC56_02815 [Phycisphaerae bacterium]|nr:hypothetical protein [Phycisphaerae bacterium]
MKRHIERYEARKRPILLHNGQLFHVSEHVVCPLGPANSEWSITPAEAIEMGRKLKSFVIRWTNGFVDQETSWHAVICDTFTSLEEYSSKHRYKINRGLKNFRVERVDAAYIKEHGYPIYRKAHDRYRSASHLWTEKQFVEHVAQDEPFDDIVHYWGVFAESELIVFAIVDIYGTTEASYVLTKADPEFLRLYPIYAMIHVMKEYYLATHKFSYINDGWKSIRHETNFQDLLIDVFRFRKAYTQLHVAYRFPLSLGVRVAYPFRSILSRLDERVAALLSLEECTR